MIVILTQLYMNQRKKEEKLKEKRRKDEPLEPRKIGNHQKQMLFYQIIHQTAHQSMFILTVQDYQIITDNDMNR